ncbi:MAG: nicotinate phosphoribosyltransferase [Bryobacteraceae bacterium]|nr:nicotinate phosphoribosyltransferase [Bryobacteraceae bacterium]MDW8378769.1 nicotinate phosphoribosyltransferase [Bryobacterales bacterium]
MPEAILTDLYQLTMAAGYFAAGKVQEKATFELFVRQLPPQRNYLIASGIQQAVAYLESFCFSDEEIAYVRGLPQLRHASPDFFDYLRQLRFTGDVFAVAEGTPIFPGEPILTVRAPIIEAQIPETYLLSMISFQTLVATKASRVVHAAAGRPVVDFGTRRAHSPQAGALAARAAYVGGCVGTSNVLAGMRYGIPVFGTAAHSWTQAFSSEQESFRQLQQLLGEHTVLLIDTYDTLRGARLAASIGRPLWGVRLDSGDLASLSRQVRAILDQAGLQDVKIMASGDLNEYKIQQLVAAQAPVDLFGVGTDLATSLDAPGLSAVYKLVELRTSAGVRFTAKLSDHKATYGAPKQVFRFADHDVIGCSWECLSCGETSEALLRPLMLSGKLVDDSVGDLRRAQERVRKALAKLPAELLSLEVSSRPWPVNLSQELLEINRKIRDSHQGEGA